MVDWKHISNLTITLILFYIAFCQLHGYTAIALGIGIVATIGIPHGGSDAWIMMVCAKGSWIKFFSLMLCYITMGFFTILTFYLSSFIFWTLFLTISIFHFGWETRYEKKNRKMCFEDHILAFTRGVTIVFLSSYAHPLLPQLILPDSLGFASGFVTLGTISTVSFVIPIAIFLMFFFLIEPKSTSINNYIEFGIILVSFAVLPPFTAFIWYFCCVHSFLHWRQLAVFASNKGVTNEQRNRKFLVGGIFTIPPLVVFCWFIPRGIGAIQAQSMIAYTFLGIAILTLPHVILVHWAFAENKTKIG
jgi:Brp/Blh family beta-carotene 15,15'-monooxygenase